MIDLTTVPGVRRQGLGWVIELPGLRAIGRRFKRIERDAERDGIPAGAGEAWRDFCAEIHVAAQQAETWADWQAHADRLREKHPHRFIMLERNRPEDLACQARKSPQDLRRYLDSFLSAADAWAHEMTSLTSPEADDPDSSTLLVGLDAEPTEHVRSVLEWLVDHQGEVLDELRPALVEMYQCMKETDPGPDEPIWFPDGPAEELALDRFELKEVSIAPKRSWIAFSFDSPSGHLQEHGCMALLVDGRLATFGTDDDLLVYAEQHGDPGQV